jgi:hypothetical protein
MTKAHAELTSIVRDLIDPEKESEFQENMEKLREFNSRDYWKKKPDMEDAGKVMFDAINVMGINRKPFVEILSSEHRTLQQDFMRLIIDSIVCLAEKYENGCFDARNEDACELSAKIVKKFRSEFGLPVV